MRKGTEEEGERAGRTPTMLFSPLPFLAGGIGVGVDLLDPLTTFSTGIITVGSGSENALSPPGIPRISPLSSSTRPGSGTISREIWAGETMVGCGES